MEMGKGEREKLEQQLLSPICLIKFAEIIYSVVISSALRTFSRFFFLGINANAVIFVDDKILETICSLVFRNNKMRSDVQPILQHSLFHHIQGIYCPIAFYFFTYNDRIAIVIGQSR